MQDLFEEIEPGNAIAFDSPNIMHWMVCVGKNCENDQLMVIHRGPGLVLETPTQWSKLYKMVNQAFQVLCATVISPTAKMSEKDRLFGASGGVKSDTLRDVIDEYGSNLTKMEIYKCQSAMKGCLCKAAAMHKALLEEDSVGYNPLSKNCENLSFFCCSSYYLECSYQAIQVVYFTTVAFLSAILFLLTLAYLSSVARSVRLAVIISSLVALIFFLISIYLNSTIRDYIFHRYQRMRLDEVMQFVRGTDEVEQKAQELIEKLENLQLDVPDFENWENDVMNQEKELLKYFYHCCQPISFWLSQKEHLRNMVVDYAGSLFTLYLKLRNSHMILHLSTVLYTPNNDHLLDPFLKQLDIYAKDLKVGALALGCDQPSNIVSHVKAGANQMVLILLMLFDPKIGKNINFWTEENVLYARKLSNEVGSLDIDLSQLINVDHRHQFFAVLNLYWVVVAYFRYSENEKIKDSVQQLRISMTKLHTILQDDALQKFLEIMETNISLIFDEEDD